MSLLFVAVVFVDGGLSIFLLPSFMLIVVPDRVAQLFIRARDLTDFIAKTAREPVLVSFVGGCEEISSRGRERTGDGTDSALVLRFGNKEYSRSIEVSWNDIGG